MAVKFDMPIRRDTVSQYLRALASRIESGKLEPVDMVIEPEVARTVERGVTRLEPALRIVMLLRTEQAANDGAIEFPTPRVMLGAKLFEFESFESWVDFAAERYGRAKQAGIRDYIAVDRAGRICLRGEHMQIARDQDRFPVMVFATRPTDEG